jgi:hypothetical protein
LSADGNDRTVELDSWATRRGLTADEKYLIEKHLRKKTLEAGTGGGRILS